jgi:transcription termination factor Rho
LLKSGTRKDELLYHADEFPKVSLLRKQLAQVPMIEAMVKLVRCIGKTSTNAELLLSGLK